MHGDQMRLLYGYNLVKQDINRGSGLLSHGQPKTLSRS